MRGPVPEHRPESHGAGRASSPSLESPTGGMNDLDAVLARRLNEAGPAPAPPDGAPAPADEPGPAPAPPDEPGPAPAPGDESGTAPAPPDEAASAQAGSLAPADEPAPAPAQVDEPGSVPAPVDEPSSASAQAGAPAPADELDDVEPSTAAQRHDDLEVSAVRHDPDSAAVFPAATPHSPTYDDPEPKDDRMPSPFDEFAAEPPRRRSRRGLVIAAVVVLLLAAAYGAGAWFLGDRTPNGATVAGVPIGGLSAADARERLADELAPLAEEQIPVSVGEAISSVDPAAVGLTLDVEATLDDLTGFTLDPRVLWGRVFGLGAVPPVSTVDEPALREALQSAATELDVAPVEGVITFAGTTPEVTEPEPGTAVDVDAATALLPEEWLTAERPIELPTQPVEPAVGTDAVADALDNLAEPLVSAPVSVSVEGKLAELTPEQLAANATFVDDGGTLVLELDGEALADAVVEANPEIVVTGQDAQIVLQNNEPTIIPSTNGTGVDPQELAAAVSTAATSANRTAEVSLVEAEPEFSTADAEALGVNEIIVDFSTPMPYDPVRTENLRVGTAKVTGTLVMPGEEFSLLEELGPIDEAHGFVSSGVVENGFSSVALGGGLSQLSTNMYNVGYLAGYDDIEHKPHSRWFDRYPAGREATLWVPTVDMIWRNNTDYGVMVHAWVTGDAVHTRLWSTPVWDVETSSSGHYNIVKPTTVYNPADDCVAEGFGPDGFTVTNTRERSKAGEVFDEESWTWTYRPWHRVVCGDPPSDG